MLNIDDRLIKEVSPRIGANALSVLLAIAIHLNQRTNRAFPAHATIMALTGLGKNAVYDALKVLKEQGLLKSEQVIDSATKRFSRRTFRLTTRFIKIFVDAVDAEPLPESREPESREPESRETYQIKEREQINNIEQIKEGNEGSAPAQGVENLSLNTPIKNDNFRGAGPAETGPQISYLDRPGARTPAELVDAMRRFYRQYPGEAEAGLMNNAKARRYNQDQRERITSEWAAHVVKTNHGGDTYQMLNADLQAWFLRQPQFEKQTPAQQQETPRRRELKTA